MAYMYCGGCGSSMDSPTLEDVVYDNYRCWCCDRKHESPKSLGEFVLELAERVADLEQELAERDR